VTVAVVREQEVNEPFEFVGRAEARQTVDLRARVQGFLQERRFEEGEDVQTGQVLFVIDPSRYQAQLASARARLSRAEATLRDTERDLARTRTLHARGTVSDADLDDATAAYEAAEAEVEAARAGVRVAEIDLEDTQIVAPVDGRIGRALVSVGNLVGPEFGPLARIVMLDPIRAAFSVSEALLVSFEAGAGRRTRAQCPRAVRAAHPPAERRDVPARGADRVRRAGGRSGHGHRRRPHPLSERDRPLTRAGASR
jgi:membrane fusion protein (multidrug efflux system)